LKTNIRKAFVSLRMAQIPRKSSEWYQPLNSQHLGGAVLPEPFEATLGGVKKGGETTEDLKYNGIT